MLTYGGRLIEAAYHASCGGKTESAGDVWKFDFPYLRSVPCPYDAAPQPVRTVSFSLPQVEKALGISIGAVPVSGGGETAPGLIKVVEKTAGGRPKTLLAGAEKIPAVVVRDRLGLRSTNFSWKVQGDQIAFTTTGYGHGVGLCQYGARGMAAHGYDYRTILRHYYLGVAITGTATADR
ncbi:MAG: putative membrane protein [Pelotomaculum thermopropionicum]|uniref:Putative membrane protein n=1 Tax=Pelotomaculum thermopropionicum TaxID=110500 RepID=A0A124FYK3_9FIRM|nr:MAG: putative membrane protein [Pelotomaculum thermopropionicum]